MDAGTLGSVALWAAAGLAALAAVTGSRRAVQASAAAAVAGTVVLAVALTANDFSLAYVARTTSLATPWAYRLAALWGGMDGSMLFYTTLTVTTAGFVLKDPFSIRVAALVAVGLALITLLFANPFAVLDIPAVDGAGLLAILQHPAMIYHPPILYLGLTLLVIPFALVLSMAGGRLERTTAMTRARVWTYVSWVMLTAGMAAGANWAYVELGWGGFWAWDPVENTALMPWLAATVFLHTSRVEEDSGRLRRWNVFAAGLPFALTVIGIYLTRSGVTGSIHSFAEDPVVGRILVVSAVLVGLIVALVALRSEPGEIWGRFRLDRDGWVAVNAFLIMTTLAFIAAGSTYPAFSSVFAGETVLVDNRFFVLTVLPVSVLIAVGLAMALTRHTPSVAVAAALAVSVGLILAVFRPGAVLLAISLVTLLSLLPELHRLRGRRLVAVVAHAGMAMLLLGVAGSSFGSEFSGTMTPGDTVTVGGHRVTLEGLEVGETDRYRYVRAGFDVDGLALAPEIRAYEEQDTPVAEPALHSGPIDDVIVAVSLLFPDGDTVEVSVFVRPLVWLVWSGAAVIGLAGLVALFWRGGVVAGRRRQARAGQLREGTTSGSGVR